MAIVKNLIIRAGADFSELEKATQKLKANLESLKKVGDNMSKFGSSMTKNVTLPIVAAATAIGAITVKAAGMADELLTLSQQTGLTTESIQGLKYASELVDVEFDTMTKGMAKVVKQIGAAVDKGADYIEVSDGMNVAIRDNNGNLKSSEQVFYDTIDAIGKLSSETEKEIATQKIFGKSYQELMPLIKAGSGAIKGYIEEAKKMGIIVSQKDLEALGKLDDSIVRLKAVAGAAGAKLAVALVPVIEKLTPVIEQKIIPAIMSFIDKIAGMLKAFSELDPSVQTVILSVIGLTAAMGPAINVVGNLIRNYNALAPLLVKIAGHLGMTKAATVANTAAMATMNTTVATSTAEVTALGSAFTFAAGCIGIFVAGIIGAQAWARRFAPELADLRAQLDPMASVGEQYVGSLSTEATAEIPDVVASEDIKPTVWDARGLSRWLYGEKADGGWISRTGAYLVGEEGPEVVNLKAGDYVTPNDRLMGREKLYGEGEAEGIFKRGFDSAGNGLATVFEAWWREGLMNNEMMGFAEGGIVPGPLGAPQLAVVHGGEEVLTPAQRQAGGVMNHTGTITVKGVNNEGELIGVAEILADNISRNDRRLPGRVSLIPI